jgi:hypothetical protein
MDGPAIVTKHSPRSVLFPAVEPNHGRDRFYLAADARARLCHAKRNRPML